jgi:hypothetical protein
MDVSRGELVVVVLGWDIRIRVGSNRIGRLVWYRTGLVVGLDGMDFLVRPLPDRIDRLNP